MSTTLFAVVRVSTLVRRRAADVWRTAAALAPQQLVERVVLRAGSEGAIAGEPTVMTIMFADLRSSTRYVLELDRPEETWAFSQAFVRRAVEAVEARHGYALSLEGGDGILAVFGPQFGGVRHARLAVAAALDLTGSVLDDIRVEIDARLPQLREPMLEEPLGMRVSVHTGEVVFGGSGTDGKTPRRWSTSTVGRATWEAAKLRAAAAPENAGNWDPAARDLIFGRPDADERIVVVSEEAMAAARSAVPPEAGPEHGFVRTSVVVAGDVAIDVWVHQGGGGEVPSTGTATSVPGNRPVGGTAAPVPGSAG
jgi:class 3 adenylate cyclase